MGVVVLLLVARATGALAFDEVCAFLVGGVRALPAKVAGLATAVTKARLSFVAAPVVPHRAVAVLVGAVVVVATVAAAIVAVVAAVALLTFCTDVALAVGLRVGRFLQRWGVLHGAHHSSRGALRLLLHQLLWFAAFSSRRLQLRPRGPAT